MSEVVARIVPKEVILVIQHASDDQGAWDATPNSEEPPDPGSICLRVVDWKRRTHDVRSVSTLNLCAASFINGTSVWTLKPIARVVIPVVTVDDDYTIVVASFVAIVLSAIILVVIVVTVIVVVAIVVVSIVVVVVTAIVVVVVTAIDYHN